jgi:hypothetical protein
MKKYRIVAYAEIEVVTLIEANNEEEAKRFALDRDIVICVHGSELQNGYPDEEEFTITDGTHNGILHIGEIEEFETEESL